MRLRCFGGLQLEGAAFNRPKLLVLICYLALEGPQGRRHLAELFWPRAKDSLGSMRAALRQLREGAPGTVDADKTEVRTGVDTDVGAFTAACERGHTTEALELYQGPFLTGIYLSDWGAELEEWIYMTREFYASQVRYLLLQRAETEAQRGHLNEAVKRAEAAYLLASAPELEPEEVQRIYALLLAGNSRYVAELRQQAASYDIDLPSPDDERRRYRRRASDRWLDAPSHNLPGYSTSFVGRDVELSEVADRLADPSCKVLTLVGSGGVGKTRLAVKAAREQLPAGRFGGLFFASLEAVTAAQAIPGLIADVIGVEVRGGALDLARLAKEIGNQRLLLVLDSIEHLTAAAPIVSGLVQACPNLTCLIASRERLNIVEEWALPLAGLPYQTPPDTSFEEALYTDALQLFIQRARRSRLDFAPRHENIAAIQRICELLEGSPLGIELAATWVRVMCCKEIAEAMAGNLDFLTSAHQNVPTRHRSMRTVLDRSWSLLSKKEQAVLKALAAFTDGFSREAAARVAGATLPVIASLVDKSLLRMSARRRYDRHPLVHEYSKERLAEDPAEEAEAKKAHGTYYLQFLRSLARDVKGSMQGEAFDMIERELDNLRLAWFWALESGLHLELSELSIVLQAFFDRRGRYQEGIELFLRSVEQCDHRIREQGVAMGRFLGDQAFLCHRMGHNAQAKCLAERGLELLHGSGIQEGLGSLHNTLGNIAWKCGDYTDAKRHFEAALTLSVSQGKVANQAVLVSNLAIAEQLLGNYDAAVERYQESIAICRQVINESQLTLSLYNLAQLYAQLNRQQEARSLLHESLELARKLSFRQAECSALNTLATVDLAEGDVGVAQRHARDAVRIAAEIGDRSSEVYATAKLGKIAMESGQFDCAEDSFFTALELASRMHGVREKLLAIYGLAELRLRQGRYEAAVDLLEVVANHPATDGLNREEAATMLEQARAQARGTVTTPRVDDRPPKSIEQLIGQVLQQRAQSRP